MSRSRSVGERQPRIARRLVVLVSAVALMTSLLGVVPVLGAQPPTAIDDVAETDDVTAIDIAVLANDVDPEMGILTIDSFTQPAPGDGTVIDNGDGTLKFTPVHGSTGTVTFDYTAEDPEGLTDTAAVTVLVNDHHQLDPFRNEPLPCSLLAPAAIGSTPRAALNMVHIKNICGFVGVDIEFQSRLDANGSVHDYAFVSTMGYGFNIYDVTDPHVAFLAGGFLDQGWENDIQVRGDVVVLTFDGVSGEDSTTSLCLRTTYPDASGQGVDIFRLNFDPAAAASGLPVQSFVVTNPTCVPNPPGGAHNATLHPSGEWLAISNCCSDWAMDLIDLRELDNGNAVHTYRYIDASRLAAARCPTVGVTFTCVAMTRPNGSSASGLWQPHDVFFSEDGTRAYVAAINASWIVDVSDVLNGAAPSIAIISNDQGVGGDNITIAHQADTSADGDMLLLTDEYGGGLTGTDCQTELSGAGKIGAGHFWALAPIPGQPGTASASESNPVRLGHWINPNPVAADETIPRAERACTIHVFRMGGNGTSSPGPIQAGFDGVSTLGARQLTVAMYGAGVWFMDFSSPPSNADGVIEDATTTWGNTLGYIIMPGADTWSAKEYKGYVYAGDIARGFDIYGFADCANVAECFIDPVGNHPPNAEDDSASVNRGASVVIDVLANDSDPDCIPITGPCDSITITSFTQPDHGSVIDNGNGNLTYTHDNSASTTDSFRYVIQDGRGGADTATVSITITQPVNAPPDAVDDTGSVNAGGSTTINVKANDSDPDNANSELTVTIETNPTHGSAVVQANGQVTYTHNGDSATSDSFTYRLTDPEGASDIATVSITITRPTDDIRKTTGGGYLLTSDGDKLNFGFNAQEKRDGSLHGNLQLNDKDAGAKIHLKTVTAFNTLAAQCGTVPPGPGSVEFLGTGTYNSTNASFRVCVADFGEPGSGSSATPDMFHLECASGCTYNSRSRVTDEQLDGGNIQVHDPGTGAGASASASAAEKSAAEKSSPDSTEASGSSAQGSSSESTAPAASTLILDPVLLTEGQIGSIKQLTVRAFGPDQSALSGVSVSINVLDASGNLLNTLTGVSNASGLVTINVVIGTGETEFLAFSGGLSSNAIAVTGRPPGGL